MRLICPNCGAQYEVPDGVVPHEGRDVQCSNCGNTWFQAHPDNDQALSDELNPPQVEEQDTALPDDGGFDTEFETDDLTSGTSDQQQDHADGRDGSPDWDRPDDDESEWQGFDDEPASTTDHEAETRNWDDQGPDEAQASDQSEHDSPAETDAHIDSHDDADHQDDHHDDRSEHDDHRDDTRDHDTQSDDTEDDTWAADDDDGSTPAEVAARDLDPSVADILQQEAEHEAKARASEITLESQPDLGLEDSGSDVDQRTREANERMARLRGDAPLEESVAATVAAASRRDLLPDIEEINSTLRSTSDRKSGMMEETYDEDYDAPRKSGRFRRGFWMIVLAALVLLLLYVFSPQIMKAFPALEGIMTSYVAMVDQLRGWLDGKLQSSLQWLDTKASDSSN